MQQRAIPALDRSMGAIGLGCMGMSWAYVDPSAIDEQASIDVIHRALDLGVTFIDTSDFYGAGHNESLVGRAIADRRDEVTLATKAGLIIVEGDRTPLQGRDGRPEHLRACVDASLQRLGTDVIDLWYLHRVDPRVPLEESWGAMAAAVQAGKVRALGLSEVTVAQAEAAHAVHPVAAVQSEFSLWTRDPTGTGVNADGVEVGDLVSWTRQHGAVFVPFSPLGRGFLTGTVSPGALPQGDFRAANPRFQAEAAEANQAIVEAVQAVADRLGAPAGAVALAWVLAQGDHIIPIPGTTKVRNLEANVAATDLVLDARARADLDALPAAVGARY